MFNFKLFAIRLLLKDEWSAVDVSQSRLLVEAYFQSIQSSFELAFPFGVVVEGSTAMVRLKYIAIRIERLYQGTTTSLSQTDVSKECLNLLVGHLNGNIERIQPKLSLALMSAYLLEADKSLCLLQPNLSNSNFDLNDILDNFINTWPCRSESQFVYFTAVLYFNWTKFVLACLKLQNADEPQMEIIEHTVQQIITFAQNYWSFNSIDQIFDNISNCLQIMCLIRSQEYLHQFLNKLYLKFLYSKNNSVYRLLYLIHRSVPLEMFEAVFKEIIATQFTLKTTLEHSLYQSNNIPTLDSLLEDEQDGEQGGGGGGETDSQLLVTFQVSNRNIDLVRFVAIRFTLMSASQMDQLCNELNDLLQLTNALTLQKFILKNLLPKLLQIAPHVYSTIHCLLAFIVQDDRIYMLKAELALDIIRLNRQHNLRLLVDENNLISRVASKHFDDSIRLEALALLVECKKTTQSIESDSLRMISRMIISCSSIQQAAARDQVFKVFRKLFARLEDSCRSESKANPTLLSNYTSFLRELIRQSFDTLHPSLYFGSLLTWLQFIKLFLDTFQLPRPDGKTTKCLPIQEHFTQRRLQVTKHDFQSLLTMVEHNFDEIRSLALSIIVTCHQTGIYSFQSSQIEQVSQWSTHLLTLIHPQKAQTGVTLCRMLLALDPDPDWEVHFTKLSQLLVELQRRVHLIHTDLMNSVHSQPSYPILSAIRALLCDQLDLNSAKSLIEDSFEWKEKWKELLASIINECMSACEAVSPIVCSDSPEGHLPEKYRDQVMREEALGDVTKHLYVNSQMLLLNGWMTVKESVLILSHLVASFPDHHAQPSLVKCSTARSVIDFLYTNQLCLVHRGAFEQSSNAFNRLMNGLWKHNCPKCCAKFEHIIGEIKSHLTSSNVHGVDQAPYRTITRRSAGLPALIQSILSAEPVSAPSLREKHSYSGDDLIATMVNMLQPKERPQAWQIVHSLNILKALIRDSRLLDAMAPWIEPIIRLCVHWFDRGNYSRRLGESNSGLAYSIRNSSSMLFSALVTRVFGVKRNRADTSRKNRMSSSFFFQSYPSLFSFLFEHAKKAAQWSVDPGKSDFSPLYPTLILLSRLTPSTSENSLFDVHHFLVPLRQIVFSCRDSRLRSLTVATYVQLLRTTSYADTFEDLAPQLEIFAEQFTARRQTYGANTLHGIGLLLAQLVLQYSYHLEIGYAHTSQDEKLSSPDEQRIRKALSEIYHNSWRILQLDVSPPAPVLQVLHILHCRIFTLAMVDRWTDFTGSNHGEALFKMTIDGSNSKNHSLFVSTESHCVALFLDTLGHCLPLGGSLFTSRLCQIAAITNEQSRDGQLLLWSFVNEFVFSEGQTDYLLRRQNFPHETVFVRQITELICARRRFEGASLFPDCLLPAVRSESFLFALVRSSIEWCNLVEGGSQLATFTSIQWDIVHSISMTLYNSRRRGFIGDMNQFLERMEISKPCVWLLDCLESVGEDENANYSLALLAHLCLTDLPVDQRVSLVNDDQENVEAKMASLLLGFSRNATSLISRQTSLFCLALSLPVWTKELSRASASKLATNYRALAIVCDLFSSLFTLLYDEEKTVRQDTYQVVRSLAQIVADERCISVKELASSGCAVSDVVTAANLAVNIYLAILPMTTDQPYGTLLLVQLAVSLFFSEDAFQDQEHLGPENEEECLFGKCKQKEYSDGDLLVQLLIDHLATFKRGHSTAVTEDTNELPLARIERILGFLSRGDMPDAPGLIADIMMKIRQVESLAKAEKKDSSRSGLHLLQINQREQFLNALSEAL